MIANKKAIDKIILNKVFYINNYLKIYTFYMDDKHNREKHI